MFAQLLIACILVSLIATAQHYFPWQLLLRRPLPRLAAYSMGMMSVLLPLSGLYFYWSVYPPVMKLAHLVSLWAASLSAGATVAGAYLLDRLMARLALAHELEELYERQSHS